MVRDLQDPSAEVCLPRSVEPPQPRPSSVGDDTNRAKVVHLRPRGTRALYLSLLLSGCGVVEEWPGTVEDPSAEPTSAAGTLSGTVSDVDGVPLPGIVVSTEPSGREATSDSAGAWLIERVAVGTYHVVAGGSGYTTATSGDLTVTDGGTTIEDLTLLAAVSADGHLRVRVEGPDGLPLVGATIVSDAGASGTTDGDGRALLQDLGGTTSTLTITDADGKLLQRSVPDVAVPALGGADLAVTLAGKAPDDRYTGSTLCVMCHTDTGAAWAATAHAEALSAVEGAPADAFASGLSVDLGGAEAWLSTVDGTATVTLTDADGVEDSWTVLGFIGGASRGAVPWAERDGRAWPLPVAWVAPEAERVEWEPGGWVATNTEPWLELDGRFAYTDTPAPEASAEAACFGCHATGFSLAADGDGGVTMAGTTRTSARWDDASVGCEACHGPGHGHASGTLSEKLTSITNPADLDDQAANDVCGQCHAAVEGQGGSPYAWSETHGLFKPGESLDDHASSAFVGWPDGAADVPGAEADELSRSGHGTGGWTARCSDCHDPHGSTYTADVRLDTLDNSLCLSCHLTRTFADSEATITVHTGHVYSPDSRTASGRCVGCHMPPTAARLAWRDASAAGDLSSHRFLAVPPSSSLAAFDAAGVDTLAPGEFEPNACQECHVWNDYLFDGGFPGPAGDMTERASHEELQAAYEVKYP